jgi:hypothetical protein
MPKKSKSQDEDVVTKSSKKDVSVAPKKSKPRDEELKSEESKIIELKTPKFVDDKYLVIRRSTIRNAGNGLFCMIDVEPLVPIVEYTGELIDVDSHENHDYCYGIDDELCIDATDIEKSNKARYINDCMGSEKKPNVCWAEDPYAKRVYMIACSKITAGDELFCPYGDDYWNNDDTTDSSTETDRYRFLDEEVSIPRKTTKKVKKIKQTKIATPSSVKF